jgi:hypothetical protein
MENYAMEQYQELLNREELNIFENHMSYGDDFMFLYGNSMMRAYIVNKMFGVSAEP